MTKTTLIYAVLSVLIPGIGFGFAFILDAIPARLPEPGIFIPLLISNALGLVLSLASLARSNERPTNVSVTMRLALLFSTIGLLGNTLAIQLLLTGIIQIPFGEG
jgi:hypothetical protein